MLHKKITYLNIKMSALKKKLLKMKKKTVFQIKDIH